MSLPRIFASGAALMRVLIPLLLAGGVRGAEPLFETTRVFALTPDNKPNYRIPSIIRAPSGDLLIIAEKRNGGPGDVGHHDIASRAAATWARPGTTSMSCSMPHSTTPSNSQEP